MPRVNIKRLWKYEIKGEVSRVGATQKASQVVAVSLDDKKAYVLTGNGQLVWDYEAKAGFNSAAISPDGSYLIFGTKDSVLTQFDQSGKVLWKENIGANSIAFSADARHFVCGGNDGNIYFLTRHAKLLWRWAIGDYLNCLAMASEEHSVVASAVDKNLYLLNSEGKQLWQTKMRSAIRRVAISADGNSIVAGGGSRFIYLFDRKCKLLWECSTNEFVSAVSITPDGNCIAAGTEGGNIFIIDKKGQVGGVCHHGEAVFDLFIASTGGLVVGAKGNVSLYKIDVGVFVEPISNLEILISEVAGMNEDLAPRYRQGAVVMFADIRDYSPWTKEETHVRKVKLAKYEELLTAAIKEHDGIKIKNVEEAYFVIFNDPVMAIKCGLKIKKVFKGYNQIKPEEERIPVRVGMDFVQLENIPAKGLPVEVAIASEITPISTDGQILMAKTMLSQIEGKMMAEFESIGRQELKCVGKHIPVYQVDESPYTSAGGWYG